MNLKLFGKSVLKAILVAIPLGMMLSCSSLESTRDARESDDHEILGAKPIAGVDLKHASYIESENETKHSCSFIEFDGSGDYLNFDQHRHCVETLKELRKNEKILLVMYCHGWKHNSQSGDVISFNNFLANLAQSSLVREKDYRVHGVYFSWRGNSFKPFVSKHDVASYEKSGFKSEIVDSQMHQSPFLKPLLSVPLQLSYWTRRKAAEHHVSGVPIARSVFTFSDIVKKEKDHNKAILMGHSFGALMLEQSVGEATASMIASDPFRPMKKLDLILLINSAAPTIYAKMLRDVGDLYNNKGNKAPFIVHVTSKNDRATKYGHRIINSGAPLNVDYWRKPYTTRLFTTSTPKNPDVNSPLPKEHPSVPQYKLYTSTPGHSKFMINRELLEAKKESTIKTEDEAFRQNISTSDDITTFSKGDSVAKIWQIVPARPVSYKGTEQKTLNSGMWIMQCEKEIIGDHNDIWNEKAMQLYAGIFGISNALSQ